MKSMITTGCFALLLALGHTAFAQNEHEATMQAWQAYMTPGPMHQMLAAANGDWTTQMTMWMAPGAEPVKSSGKCTNSMILGGRYQKSVYAGDFMGMPMEGISTLGYDNSKKLFINTWIDNMGTGIMFMEGKLDEATHTITFLGSQVDPTNGKDMKVKQTYTFIDNNNHKMEMYMIMDGDEFKTMEILYKRA